MYSNKSYRNNKSIPGCCRGWFVSLTQPLLCVLLLILVLHPLLFARQSASVVDRIAAVVNDEIITLTDIDKAIRFYPVFRQKHQSEDRFYAAVLEDLINYKVLYLEYRTEFTLKEDDFVEVQTAAIEKTGSLDEFRLELRAFDMEWKDFKTFVREKVVYEKALDKQLQEKTSISFREVEKFYNTQYVPAQERLGLTPRSLIEMTSQIKDHLHKIRTRETLADWLKEIKSSYQISNKLTGERKDNPPR